MLINHKSAIMAYSCLLQTTLCTTYIVRNFEHNRFDVYIDFMVEINSLKLYYLYNGNPQSLVMF